MANWITTSAIKFETNGVKLFRDLNRAADRFNKTLAATLKSVDAVNAAWDRMSASAARATASVSDLSAAMNGNAASGATAASGARSATSAYTEQARAADRATAALLALNRAQGYTALGSSASPLRLGPGTTGGALVPIPGLGSGLSAPGSSGFTGSRGTPYVLGPSAGSALGTSAGTSYPASPNTPAGYAFPTSGGSAGRGPGGPGGPGSGGSSSRYGRFDVLPIPGVVGHAATLAADAVGGALVDGYYQAGKLQTILKTTQNITGASSAQMANLRKVLIDTGDQTGMSEVESATMFRDVARNTQGSMSFAAQEKMFEAVAKAQVVLGATRHFTPEKTSEAIVNMAHLFRDYNPDDLPGLADLVIRSQELASPTLSQATKQFTMMAPVLDSLRVSKGDQEALYIAMARTGFGTGRGGASTAALFNNALGPLQLTNFAQKGKELLLGPKGMNILDANGKSRFFKDGKPADIFGDPKIKGDKGFLGALYDYEQRVGETQAAKAFKSAFGIQGSRIAELFSDPIVVDQIDKLRKALNDPKNSLNLDNQVKQIQTTAQFEEGRAWKNFESLITEIGYIALPGATKGFKDLGDAFHNAQHWLNEHKSLMNAVGKWITDTVISAEKFLVSHKTEIKAWGKDIEDIGQKIAAAGPAVIGLANALFTLGDAMDSAYEPIRDIINIIDKHFAGYKKWAGDQTNKVKLTPAERYDLDHPHQSFDTQGLRVFEDQVRHWLHLDKPNLPGVTKPPARTAATTHPAEHHPDHRPDHRERVREVAHTTTHHHTTTNHFHIQAHDPKAVADEVKKLFAEVAYPQSVLKRNGNTRTHPSIPSPLTTWIG